MHNDNLAKDIHLTFLLPQQKFLTLFVYWQKLSLLSYISLSLQIIDIKFKVYTEAKKQYHLWSSLELP